MKLSTTTSQILRQLLDVIVQLDREEYSSSLPLLSNSSIGQHVRHIIELYQCLLKGYDQGEINYDERKREVRIEIDSSFAEESIHILMEVLSNRLDKELMLRVNYSTTNDEVVVIRTSFNRELAYNIEHAIHHMAIIRIAIQQYFAHIHTDGNFGIAPSTVRHQLKCVQ